MRLAVRAALLLERRQVGKREDVSERRQALPARLDLVALRLVLADHPDRLGVLEDVLDVARRRVRVDRGPDGSDVRQGEVQECPLERVPRQDPERIALMDTTCEQAVRE